jgi:hypothetical protein
VSQWFHAPGRTAGVTGSREQGADQSQESFCLGPVGIDASHLRLGDWQLPFIEHHALSILLEGEVQSGAGIGILLMDPPTQLPGRLITPHEHTLSHDLPHLGFIAALRITNDEDQKGHYDQDHDDRGKGRKIE